MLGIRFGVLTWCERCGSGVGAGGRQDAPGGRRIRPASVPQSSAAARPAGRRPHIPLSHTTRSLQFLTIL